MPTWRVSEVVGIMSENSMRQMANGWAYSTIGWACSIQLNGQRAKTRMNVSRYSASGMTQNSGMGDRSVVMCVVMPSIRLDGTAASNTQRSRRQPSM